MRLASPEFLSSKRGSITKSSSNFSSAIFQRLLQNQSRIIEKVFKKNRGKENQDDY